MKNMKIAVKLIVGFSIVVLLACIVGAIGIVGMSQINTADDGLYNLNLLPVGYIGQIRAEYNIQRTYSRDIIIYPAESEEYANAVNRLKESEAAMDELIRLYEPTIELPEDLENFTAFKNAYYNDYVEVKAKLIESGNANDFDGASEVMRTIGAAAQSKISPALIACMDLNSKEAENTVNSNTSMFKTMTTIQVVVLILSVILAFVLAFYISSLISKPMGYMYQLMEQVGKKGDLDIAPDLNASLEKGMTQKDEIGNTIIAFKGLMDHMTNVADAMSIVANKDLSRNISVLSDKDTLGLSLVDMQDSLNKMFAEINSASDQVSTGSVQIADGAQLLAQGATEQSATVEQLSASVAEIADQTKNNAATANEAKELGEDIKVSAEQGSSQMEQMMQAVQEINESSKSIGKVIKIIDDIAFQTNILALNAAVEAARAGQHGKGFAVVADEVRSLAAKSAEAAKNTNELIESSIKKAEQGASISADTSESLNQIVQGILRTSELISDIAKSSNEQSVGIGQVSDAIEQVSQVVQQNSATAEQSAAASEEMSGQATLLQQLISQFKLKGSTASAAPVMGAAAPIQSAPAETGFSIGDKY